MNLEKLKDTARKHEQKEEWRKAIEVYRKAIEAFESGEEPRPTSRSTTGSATCYLKVSDTPAAVRSYERAVDLYTDQGFFNNAIAALRQDPPGTIPAGPRPTSSSPSCTPARTWPSRPSGTSIEYLERMNRDGLLDRRSAVKAFADQFASSQEIRVMLVELLRVASRGAEAREQLEKLASDLESRGDQAGAQRTRERMNEIETKSAAAGRGAAPQGRSRLPRHRPGHAVRLARGIRRPDA